MKKDKNKSFFYIFFFGPFLFIFYCITDYKCFPLDILILNFSVYYPLAAASYALFSFFRTKEFFASVVNFYGKKLIRIPILLLIAIFIYYIDTLISNFELLFLFTAVLTPFTIIAEEELHAFDF